MERRVHLQQLRSCFISIAKASIILISILKGTLFYFFLKLTKSIGLRLWFPIWGSSKVIILLPFSTGFWKDGEWGMKNAQSA